MICENCGEISVGLSKIDKKCIPCRIIEACCKSTCRKCWNDIIKDMDYYFIRSLIKPTFHYFLNPIKLFETVKLLNESKRERLSYR